MFKKQQHPSLSDDSKSYAYKVYTQIGNHASNWVDKVDPEYALSTYLECDWSDSLLVCVQM